MASTPLRNVRVPESLWSAALAAARANGTTVSAVIVDLLDEYVREQRDRPTG
jgi:hypothetical protein